MNRLFDKKYLHRWFLAVAYVLVFASFIYSIYYSMPANDDFAWAIEWWSGNRFVEMFHRIGWNYTNSWGNSGIFAIAIQVLLNPLYLFNNSAHSFGISMIIANAIIMFGILWAVRTIFKYMFRIASQRVLDFLTFAVALLVTTSYYYSDVYNWWSGTPGYSGMMMMCMITWAAILRYLDDTDKTGRYIGMIILGMITCTSMMYCVAVGAFYVLFTFIVERDNDDSIVKKLVPIFMYVIAGVLMVIAPGIGARMSNENSAGYSLKDGLVVTAHRILSRLIDTLQTKPWVLGILVIILFIGMYAGSKKKINIFVVVLGFVMVTISAFSGVLLYVYGSAKKIDSEFTPRVYYVEDYMMFIGGALVAYAVGAWFVQLIGRRIRWQVAAIASVAAIIVTGFYSLRSGGYNTVIQYDIVQKRQLIKESWNFWDDILQQIQAAKPGSDIVIERDNVDWCQYSYYVSLDDIPREPLDEDARYGNCNQCASKFYGMRSIIVKLK